MEFIVWKQLFTGKTIVRALMNAHSSTFSVSGTVLDVGGGEGSSYLKFIKGINNSNVINIDLYRPSAGGVRIDLEKDSLSQKDGSVENVLLFNLLEHIYNTHNVLAESYRVLKNGGTLIGFIPFLVNYHADPHDYVRLTDESLKRRLNESGFSSCQIIAIGHGPFTVNLNNIASMIPGPWIGLVYPLYRLVDATLVAIKPNLKKRFPLGYFFVATK